MEDIESEMLSDFISNVESDYNTVNEEIEVQSQEVGDGTTDGVQPPSYEYEHFLTIGNTMKYADQLVAERLNKVANEIS